MKSSVFLNYGATAPIRESTAAYMSQLCTEMSHPLGTHFYAWLGLIEQTRRRLADLIGAFPSEIAFFNNTSTALSMLALALPLTPGDVVLAAGDEFSSNRFVWQNLQAKGVIFRTFETQKDQSLIQTLSLLDLKRVKLISLSAVSYCSGRLYELKAFADFCQAHGIWSCLDAIQAVGATAINCHDLGIDFLAGGGQKWLLGPIGCGYLYAKQNWVDKLFVPLVGWTSSKYPERHDIDRLEFCDEMARFEPGLPNFLPIAGLGHSLEKLQQKGWPLIFDEIQKRSRYLKKNLHHLGYDLLTPIEAPCAGIVSAKIPDHLLPRLAAEHFEKHHIQITVRHFLRASPHYDTPWEHLDRFLEAAAELKNKAPPQWTQAFVSRSSSQPVCGKTAWLIGASGSIGEALAQQLCHEGYHLEIVARHQKELETLAQDLDSDSKVTIHCADIADPQQLLTLCQKLKKPVDLMIIACAGNKSARFDQVDPAIFHQMGILPGIGALLGAFEKAATAKAQVVGILSLQAKFSVPYMSYSHAIHLGLESLLRSFEFESGLWTELVLAPSCHSKLQKRIGRILLRYFRSQGKFNYEHPEKLACDIVQSIQKRQKLKLPLMTRLKIGFTERFPFFSQRLFQKFRAP